MQKTILRGRAAVVLAAALVLASCRKNTAVQSPPAARPRGELISAVPTSPTAPAMEISTGEKPRRKHPRPPSVQRRMVLDEWTLLSQTNLGNAPLASGTAGTAADLARTNLPSITSMALADVLIPGYKNISFSTLAGFEFNLTPRIATAAESPADTAAAATAQIPPGVRSLDGGKVVISGFLLPVKMNDGLAVEFLLMRNQSMCCYGVAPKINEWITVQMRGKGVKPVMDQPISVAGVLHVGPILENGALAGLYSLDSDEVRTPF